MSSPREGMWNELEELVAAACDGPLSDQQTERLEQLLLASSGARRYYLLYLHLHGELHWQQAAAAGPLQDALAGEGRGMRLPTPAFSRPKPDRISRLRLIGFCLSALVAIALLVLAYRALPQRKKGPPAPPPVAASPAVLTGAVQPRWAPGSAPPAIGQPIPLDRRLTLENGVIEITHEEGDRLLIEAPAVFRYRPGKRIELESGKATVCVTGETTFLLEAGGADVEPVAGVFGMKVGNDSVELHLLEAAVRVVRPETRDGEIREGRFELAGREAVRWSADSAEPPASIPVEASLFPTELPERAPSHSVARMRSLVANHPHLLHQYTFEGTSRIEKCQDKRGALHLTEAVMVAGRGRGTLDYTARGFDLTTEAIRPHREPQEGNENGVALQSEVRFRPPAAMTIELLLRWELPADADDETIALAVANRDGDRDCGFYVASVGRGHLTLLLDGEADWTEMNTLLEPDRWYFVAVTFEAGEDDTAVNAYVADLEAGTVELRQVLQDETVSGTPATSRLGIGKGFDYTGAHAYPWSGELDEVAVYDAVLEREELQRHLDALVPGNGGR